MILARPYVAGLILAAALSLPAAAQPDPPIAARRTPCAPRPELGPQADSGPSALVIRGCLNRSNLAAMLVNPADLTRGRPLGPTDGAHAAAAVEAYQKGMAKGLGTSSASSSTQLLLPAIQTGVR